jgi:hypothetical protein
MMAVVVTQDFESTLEDYEKVNEKLGSAPPEGLILHAGIDLGGGKMRAMDVWESVENFQSWVQEKLIPAIAEVNPDAPQAGEPEIHEVHDLLKA